MRKIYLTLLFLFSITFVMAQAPQKFNYQAVARNASGDVLENQNIGVRISVLNGSSSGMAVYVETHDVSTNQFGLFTLAIGGGTVSSGSFPAIDWAGGSKYLQVEFDPNGGTSYIDMGASQLLSVPYALHAGNSGVTAGAGISVSGGVVTNTAPDQTVSITGTGLANVTGTYPNFSINVAPLSFTAGAGINIIGNVISVVDTSFTNELQTLALNANNLTLSNGGGTVSLVPFLDNTDAQTLSLTGTTLSITGGNSLNLSAINTDSQTLTISGNNLSITGGNTIALPTLTEIDGSITNEIQILSISGNTISLTNGGSIILPAEVDGSITNEIQTISKTGSTITLSNGGGSITDSDEQTLSLSGASLSISGGNTITLPTGTTYIAGTGINITGNTISNTGDLSSTNEIQTISETGNIITLSNGGGIVTDNDEQSLSLTGTTLAISNGNNVNLSSINTDSQTLSVTGNNLTITGGNTVALPTLTEVDGSVTNEIQTLSVSGNSLSITGGNTVTLPAVTEVDGSVTNELQTISKTGNTVTLSNGGGSVTDDDNQNLSITGNTLSITGGNSVILPSGTTYTAGAGIGITGNTISNTGDVSSTNEIQTLSIAGNTISLTGGGSVSLPTEIDGSTTNEIQTLSISGNTLTLNNGGGSVTLPSSSGNGGTLDAAYDFGGPGAGREITADSGAVKISGGDGLLVTGGTLYEGDTISNVYGPVMYFNPRKRAFRAGEVLDGSWNNVNVGAASTALGGDTKASGSFSTALGNHSIASGTNSTATGNFTRASGSSSTAMGSGSVASALQSTAIGYNTMASGVTSVALGGTTVASGPGSTAIGLGTKARSYGETALGMHNTNYTPLGILLPNENDRLFSIGNGTHDTARSDAMVVLKNGNVGFGTSTPDNKLTVATDDGIAVSGVSQNGTGAFFASMVGNALTTGTGRVGIGTLTPQERLDVDGAIRISDAIDATTSPNGTIRYSASTGFQGRHGNLWVPLGSAVGSGNTLNDAYNYGGGGAGREITANNGAVKITGGDGFIVTGEYGVGADVEIYTAGTRMFFNPKQSAFRAGTVAGINWVPAAIGEHSVGMGYNPRASGDGSVAMGDGTTAAGHYSVALGAGTKANAIFSFAMGLNTTAASRGETVFGTNNTLYTPISVNGWDPNDRLFTIGNGDGVNSDALVILKNGNMGLGTSTPTSKLEVINASNHAITANTQDGTGVRGVATGSGTGVFGQSNTGVAATFISSTGNAVVALSGVTGTAGSFTSTGGMALYADGGVKLKTTGAASGKFLKSIDVNGTSEWADLPDNSATNEIQYLSLVGNQLSLSGTGNPVNLPGLVLPYTGVGTNANPLFQITNTATQPSIAGVNNLGVGILGQTNNGYGVYGIAYGTGKAGYFVTDDGNAVEAISTNGLALSAQGGIRLKTTGAAAGKFLMATDANGTVQWVDAPSGGGGGSSPWTVNANEIYNSNTGKVLVGTNSSSTGAKLEVYDNTAMGKVASFSNGTSSYMTVLNVNENSLSGNPPGCDVCAGTKAMDVKSINGDALFARSTNGRGIYLKGGNGTSYPAMLIQTNAGVERALDIEGKIKIVDGNQAAGKVLTSDANGLATWQTPAASGSGSWTTSGNNMYSSNTGNVGIGVASPIGKLDIAATANATALKLISPDGFGVFATTNTGIAGYFASTNTNGTALATGFGRVGIGVLTPHEKLDVNGAIKLGDAENPSISDDGTIRYVTGIGFQGKHNNNWVDLGGAGGYTAGSGIYINSGSINAADDSPTNELQNLSMVGNTLYLSGSGASVNLPGLTLPYDGSGSFSQPAFRVTSNSSQPAIQAYNSSSQALSANTFNGYGISTNASNSGTGIYASSYTGIAGEFYGLTTGSTALKVVGSSAFGSTALYAEGTIKLKTTGAAAGKILSATDTDGTSQWIDVPANYWTQSFSGIHSDNASNVGIGTNALSSSRLAVESGPNMAAADFLNLTTPDIATVYVSDITSGLPTTCPSCPGSSAINASSSSGDALVASSFDGRGIYLVGGSTDYPAMLIEGNYYSTVALEMNKKIKIADGSQGVNKVLTSDVDGLATWQNAAWTSDDTSMWVNEYNTKRIGIGTNAVSNSTLTVNSIYSTNTAATFSALGGTAIAVTGGKVTIGDNAGITPTAKLHVQASGYIAEPHLLLKETTGGYVYLGLQNSSANGWSVAAYGDETTHETSQFNIFYSGTGANMFSVNGIGNATLAGTLTQSSDMRLKTNIRPLENSLEKVTSINGYNYNWKPELQKDTTNQIGFMAQEVERIFPELVSTDVNGYKSVAYQNLVPVLVEALKEQQKQIDELKAQKEQATGQYEELNAKLETLTKMMLEMQGQTNGQK